MSPDELRALADALERFSLGTGKIGKAADYLRACADEKPVGVYVHRPAELRYGVEWLVGDPMPNGTQLFTHPAPTEPQADAQPVAWSDGLGSFIAADERVGDDPDILAYRVPLYTHPAPTAPQAEPKREPLTALRILEIEDDANRKWRDNGRIIEYAVVFARMIEHAHGISGGGND